MLSYEKNVKKIIKNKKINQKGWKINSVYCSRTSIKPQGQGMGKRIGWLCFNKLVEQALECASSVTAYPGRPLYQLCKRI